MAKWFLCVKLLVCHTNFVFEDAALSLRTITQVPALNSGHNGKMAFAVYGFTVLHPSSV